MQIKSIQKVIRTKLEEWLSTITDAKLVEELRDNILVSGGCITSMLMNEQVNDYDVYIKDMDVLKWLCKYYTSKFPEIVVWDGRYDMQNCHWDSRAEVAKRNLKPDQIKLFMTDWSGMRVNEDIPEDKLNYDPVFFSPNAISLSNNLQIVCRFHGDNVAIHKTFDYIHATNYFTFKDGLVTNKEAIESILTKQLKYQGSQYPLTSIIRMKKFIKRGFNINAWEILKIMFQIGELDLKNPDVLEEQLIGVDIAYFWTLIDILRWVNKDKMCSAYMNEIIDRVFNQDDFTE